MVSVGFYLVLAASIFAYANADTPANCTYDDLIGTWNIYMKSGGHNSSVNCTTTEAIMQVNPVVFEFVTKAVKLNDGERGRFTLIYNQGFEFEIGLRKFFAFFAWKTINKTTSEYWCNRTMYGWSHDVTQHDWACFVAIKQNPNANRPSKEFTQNTFPSQTIKTSQKINMILSMKYSPANSFIKQLNVAQTSWVAERNHMFENKLYKDLLMLAGHKKNKLPKPNVPKPKISNETKEEIAKLPESFDWRNISGVNYVSPVRNQGSCGSCYAFASAGMLESRIRIATNNTQKPVLSTQGIIGCSKYSQGCDGGFPYLIAGKYAEDYGFIEESCYPYKGVNTECQPLKKDCRRYYATGYRYVGGYYGACSEDLMKLSLVRHGPVAVGFEVYPDFMLYKGGVYHHVEKVKDPFMLGKFNPFQLTNHAVLVVGYGTDPKTKENYWIVKNSWGTSWGEMGYFRIRRGNDECGIESLAVDSFPIPQA